MAPSNAAIATLTVPAPIFEKDALLAFFVSLLPAYQVKVSIPKKGSSLSLCISNTPTKVITARNAILRTLSSLSLLNRLDNYPLLLLGGFAEAATGSASSSNAEAAMVFASISSYMSIASMIRTDDAKEEHILESLNEVLASNSFLVGNTSKPTLADYDVFYALSEKYAQKADAIGKDMVNLKRWIVSVQSSVEELVEYEKKAPTVAGGKLNMATILPFDIAISDPVPAFFYGEEEAGSSPVTSATAQNAPAQSKQSDAKAAPAQGGKKELTEEEKKAAAEKRAKKAAEKKAKKKNDAKPKGDAGGKDHNAPAEYDASALDIRVGKIIEVWEHEGSDKLWCEKIDLGEGEPRQILSGLRAFYKKEEMQDRMVLALCNLKKRSLAGVPSHGMVLCASNADHTAVEFVVPPEGAKIGERVIFEGLSGEPQPENKVAKKKILEKVAPDLKTDDNGVVVWKTHKSSTSSGPCVASKGMKGAQVS